MTEKYKGWADECSKIFGGLDILAVDAIHTKKGKEYIIEVNDTSIGLAPCLQFQLIYVTFVANESEDQGYIRDLVIERMKKIYEAE